MKLVMQDIIADCSIRVCHNSLVLVIHHHYRYQLVVVIADNVTESQEWTLSSLAEALTDQVRNVYITAEFSDTAPLNTIELGDGKYYGRYFNNPLLPGSCYRVAIRIVYDDVRY